MDPLVPIAWLADNLQNPDLVVFDATLPPVGVSPVPDVQARYLAAHIPGALWFDIEALSDHGTPLPHMLPSEADFAAAMGALGVRDDQHHVVYEQTGVFSAPRARWMLRTMGAARVSVLDGDLRAWQAAGHATEAGEPRRPHALFRATLRRDAVRTLADMQRGLTPSAEASREQVLDARAAGRFAGTAPEPRPGLPSGHMPGAVNVPFTDLVHNGRLKSRDELEALFGQRGIRLTDPLTTTCGSGVTAAVLALALERCGATEVRLYDGSWAEYAQQPDVVIESIVAPQLLTPQE